MPVVGGGEVLASLRVASPYLWGLFFTNGLANKTLGDQRAEPGTARSPGEPRRSSKVNVEVNIVLDHVSPSLVLIVEQKIKKKEKPPKQSETLNSIMTMSCHPECSLRGLARRALYTCH